MQTITMKTATTAEAILAIDLGKYKSVACLYGAADDVRFLSIPTSRDELTRLLAKHRPGVVLIEACLLSSWVHDLCVAHGVKCQVANTGSIARHFVGRKEKDFLALPIRLTE
jgi:hypothetical protein